MISKLYVDFNSKVTQGQVIAEIDPKLFQGAVLQAQADLQSIVLWLEKVERQNQRSKRACLMYRKIKKLVSTESDGLRAACLWRIGVKRNSRRGEGWAFGDKRDHPMWCASTQLLRHGSLSYQGGFCNLASGHVVPLPIRA